MRILEYHRLYQKLHIRADKESLLDAAYIIQEGCGDDGFKDFRAWLIAQGKVVYEAALKDPESLVDYVALESRYDIEAELIGYVAEKAYDRKTNTHNGIPANNYIVDVNSDRDDGCSYTYTDEPLDDCVKKHYPKLWAKFGW